MHFQTTHPERHKSCAKPIAMQLSYIRRCHIGPAQFLVEDINFGSRISRAHITLVQRGRPTVAGYLTMSDEISEVGVTLPTTWNVPIPPPRGLPLLNLDEGEIIDHNDWQRVVIPHPEFRRASSRVEIYQWKGSPTTLGSGVAQWARLRPWDPKGHIEKWTMESVAFLSDILPTALGRLERAMQENVGSPAPVWFPTIAFNIDFKRCALGDGHEWLFSHIHIKSIQNGRMDVEVVIVDASGVLVAVATQAALVVSSDRNMANRNVKEKL